MWLHVNRQHAADGPVSGVTRCVMRASPLQNSKPPFLKSGSEGKWLHTNQHRDPVMRCRHLASVWQQVYQRFDILHCCVVVHTNDITGILAVLPQQPQGHWCGCIIIENDWNRESSRADQTGYLVLSDDLEFRLIYTNMWFLKRVWRELVATSKTCRDKKKCFVLFVCLFPPNCRQTLTHVPLKKTNKKPRLLMLLLFVLFLMLAVVAMVTWPDCCRPAGCCCHCCCYRCCCWSC